MAWTCRPIELAFAIAAFERVWRSSAFTGLTIANLPGDATVRYRKVKCEDIVGPLQHDARREYE